MSNFISGEGFEKTFRFGRMILEGTGVTVLLALFTVIIGFILGILLAIMRMSDVRPLRFLGQDRQGVPATTGCWQLSADSIPFP